MAPLRGWAPRGHRLAAKVPHGRWNTMTFLAALRHDRIDAPWFIEGPIDGESFRLYVEKVLLPTLRPGDIVIMDNLAAHKSAAARAAIEKPPAPTVSWPRTPWRRQMASSAIRPSSKPGPWNTWQRSSPATALPLGSHGP